MRLNFMLHGGREPAIRLLSIQKANFAVPCLPVSSRTPKLTARGKHLLNIASRLHFSLKEHVLLSGCRDANMVCAGIHTKRYLLFVATAAIKQLDRERNHPHHLRFVLLQEQACFSWLTWHQRLPVTI